MDQVGWWLLSAANDQFSKPGKGGRGLRKRAGPQLQPPSNILAGQSPTHLQRPPSHPRTEAPGAWPLSR